MLEYWTENLEKLLAIEKYYEIQFSLQYIEGEDNLINLYTAIDNVYDGISMNNNCFITLSGGHFDDNIEINEPFLFQENTNISLPEEVIHNYTFHPYKSYVLPGIIYTKGTTSDDIIEVSACCQYIIESSH